MKKGTVRVASAVLLAVAVLCGCGEKKDYAQVREDIADSFPIKAEPDGENPQIASSKGPYAVVHTTAGDVTILLYPEEAPKAVENFIGLAKEGYYDGSSFHYAKKDELVQGGRPVAMEAGESDREEAAECSIWGDPFEDEFSDTLHHVMGAVGMAGAANGANQNLSQFYFIVQDSKSEDGVVASASFYMNELIRLRWAELNEKTRGSEMSEEEVKQFETALNEEIQKIGTEGVPEEFLKRYEPALEQYRKVGGAWGLDYKYTVFGQIVKGLNVAKAMTEVKVDAANRKPKQDLLIHSIEILDTLEE